MTHPKLLEKRAETPTPAGGLLAVSAGRLPADILREASRRLGWAALLYSATFFLAYFGGHTLGVLTGTATLSMLLDSPLQTTTAVVAITLGVLLFFASRRSQLAPGLLLDVGLVFEVVAAFGIATAEFWGVYGQWPGWEVVSQGVMGVSWVCVWILFFPMLAPNTPGKVLLASLTDAMMPSLVVLLSQAFGATSPEAPVGFLAIYLAFSSTICALLAYVTSRLVYRFGIRLQKAREVGSYQLVEPLGVGGMGEVWRASHRMLARPAAVKLIRPEVLGGDQTTRQVVLTRFQREAEATAALRSVHTIQLHDFGVTEDGSFYYVMELLDGLSFKDLVERFGPVPPGRVVHLLRQACHSLGEAHQRGMIHRDVKPANLYTCRLGPDHDFVKVLDFGLVKSTDDALPGATELTAAGVVTGTPAFIPPEAATGQGGLDGRADLYALGCVAYWLLTGKHVFEGDTPMAVVLDHVRTPPVPPSRRTEIEVPADLEALVLSCLAKEPADRPEGATELSRMLADTGLDGAWGAKEAAAWWNLHLPMAGDSAGRPAT
jgi:serine/threonine-protein kinase